MSDELRDYQREGIDWLVSGLVEARAPGGDGNKALLLADDPGLGKTRQTLDAAWCLLVRRMLVVCPAGARRVWSQEIERWFPLWKERLFLIEPGTSTLKVRDRLADPRPLILILSYDEMSNHESHTPAALRGHRWDLLVLDEAHYLKNLSRRTIQIYGQKGDDQGLQAQCDRVILLTGTPTPNHAGELYHHARTFWPERIRSRRAREQFHPMSPSEFEERFTRYKDTVYGRQVSGSKNQQELRERLQDVILRRRKDDVLPELPMLVTQDVPLDAHQDRGAVLDVHQRLAGILGWSRDDTDDDRLVHTLQLPDAQLASLRRELGNLKVRPTIAWVQERMASANKLLVFAWHREVIEHLRRGLAAFSPVIITGATAPKDRYEAVRRFQDEPGTRLFIGQILAAGTAITLTAANEVAIVEPSWVPGQNAQAICRAHRLGQRDSVLASFLYLPGTLDQRIMAAFRRKAAEISDLQGDLQNATGNPRADHPGPGRGGPGVHQDLAVGC